MVRDLVAPSAQRQQRKIKTLADFVRGIATVPLSDHPGQLGPMEKTAGLSSKFTLCTLTRTSAPQWTQWTQWTRNSYWYGFSFDVLGRVLEVVGKKRLDKARRHCIGLSLPVSYPVEVLAETVFEPLGMKQTKWAVGRNELHKLAACHLTRM